MAIMDSEKDCVERNIITLFRRKQTFLQAIGFIRGRYQKDSIVESFDLIGPNKAMLMHKGSQHISTDDLPDDSVDLIITDPPYLGQVLYSEYMQLYAPILGLTYNLEDEIIVSSGEQRNKDKASYYFLLHSVFKMCSKKLKKGRFLCLFFHDSDLSVNEITKSLYECGFHFRDRYTKKNVTLKNIISPKKSLGGDSVLFFTNSKLERPYVSGKSLLKKLKRISLRKRNIC